MKIELTEKQANDIYFQVRANSYNSPQYRKPVILELDDDHSDRLERMKNYRAIQDSKAHFEEIRIRHRIDDIRGSIYSLRYRIDKILETANACIQYDIPIWKDTMNIHVEAKYENGCFETDGIYHQLGLINIHNKHGDPKPEKYEWIGYQMGGACGCYDFWTNGRECYDVNENNRDDKNIYPALKHMEKFERDFENFEKKFFAYIDSVTEGVEV